MSSWLSSAVSVLFPGNYPVGLRIVDCAHELNVDAHARTYCARPTYGHWAKPLLNCLRRWRHRQCTPMTRPVGQTSCSPPVQLESIQLAHCQRTCSLSRMRRRASLRHVERRTRCATAFNNGWVVTQVWAFIDNTLGPRAQPFNGPLGTLNLENVCF